MPTARFSQAARENEKTTPTVSTESSRSFVERRKRSRRGATVSSIRIRTAGTRNGPKTFGILEQPLRARAVHERGGAGEGRDERQAGDGGRERGADQVGEQDEPRAPDRAHVGGEPEREHAEVERDREVRDRAGPVGRVGGGEQVQREEAADEHASR